VAFEDLLAVRWMLARRLRYSAVEEGAGSAPLPPVASAGTRDRARR